jgi:hypothetical protein
VPSSRGTLTAVRFPQLDLSCHINSTKRELRGLTYHKFDLPSDERGNAAGCKSEIRALFDTGTAAGAGYSDIDHYLSSDSKTGRVSVGDGTWPTIYSVCCDSMLQGRLEKLAMRRISK